MTHPRTKTELLDDLFNRWTDQVPEYRGHFIRDGIIDETRFDRAKRKVLFMMKEPNNPKQNEWSFRDLWKNRVVYRFSFRLAEWAYGIQHEFPPYAEVRSSRKNLDDAIRSVALVNIKKSGGKSSSNHNEIKHHCEMNKELLLDEIKIIKPDVILLGTGSGDIRRTLFGEIDRRCLEHDIILGEWENIPVFDFFHASARKPGEWLYEKLKDAWQQSLVEAGSGAGINEVN